jgi:small subunit ribosomal protein S4
VYRAGFAKSRAQARQLVAHAHVTLNGRVSKTPSTSVKTGDVVSIADGSRGATYFKDMLAWAKTQTRPAWLEVDPDTFTARIVSRPERGQIEAQIDTQLIVEHYSR